MRMLSKANSFNLKTFCDSGTPDHKKEIDTLLVDVQTFTNYLRGLFLGTESLLVCYFTYLNHPEDFKCV